MKVLGKKVFRFIGFYIKAGEASVTPPIGPLLGQFPMDVKKFCNNFNVETAHFEKGVILKIVLTLYKDGTFSFKISSPPIFFLLELASKELVSSFYWYKEYVGIILSDIYLIVLIKNADNNLLHLKQLFKKLIKEAKKRRYKILEKETEGHYYMYI